MAKSVLVLLALVLVGVWMIGCGGDDGPAEPGGGGGTANRAPATPTIDTGAGAPDDGSTDRAISSILHWQCSDPDGDDLTFEVFFGTAADPPSVNTQTAENYTPAALDYSTKYYWKIVAEDPDGLTASSAVWDFTTMAQGAETVSTPTAPTGPATGGTSEDLSFATGGATNSAGHAVEYLFDWGDGTYSDWHTSITRLNSWAAAGTYNVKAQARCSAHNAVESAWSAGHDVVISSSSETVSTPPTPTGPATGETSESLGYRHGDATSSEGHTLEYRFDWGDGEFSSWTTSSTVYHRFDTPGTYDIKAQARCRDHTDVESAWSAAASVVITAAAEVVSRPPSPYGPSTGYIGDTQDYEMSHGVNTTLGHDVEYRYDWNDGTFSDWSPLLTASHVWTVAGEYWVIVTARCADHTSIVSDTSPSFKVVITDAAETVSAPTTIRRTLGTIDINRSIWHETSGSVSSHGHDVEYRFDWDDGSMSGWVAYPTTTYHTWTDYGIYEVKTQGRCIADTLVVSDWSAPINLTVRESVSVPAAPTGPGSGVLGATLTYTASGSVSSGGHALEYRLRVYIMGESVYTDWSATGVIEHVFTRTGQHDVRAQARCITHPTSTSNTGNRLYVTITDP